MDCAFLAGQHAGVTLDHGNLRGAVRVTRLDKKDLLFKSGVRVGDVIVCVNGVRITTSHTAVRMIEACRLDAKPVTLVIQAKRRTT